MRGVFFKKLEEEKKECGKCGEVEVLRPFGEGGTWVCRSCSSGDIEKNMEYLLQRLEEGDDWVKFILGGAVEVGDTRGKK